MGTDGWSRATARINSGALMISTQSPNASDNPIIARFYERTGHDFAGDEALAKEQVAEMLAFVMKATGLKP